MSHSLKQTNLKMVGDVYSDIKISQLSSMLGLDTDQTVAAASSEGCYQLPVARHLLSSPLTLTHLGWTVDTDRGFVKPSPVREKQKTSSNNEDTLEKIISFVSYMEN